MAATKLSIYNQVLVRLGEAELAAITDDQNSRRILDVIYDDVLEQVLTNGPKDGWRFTKTRTNVDVDSTSITAFADGGTDTNVTAASHGLLAGEMVKIEDTTSYNGDWVITAVDDENTFTIDTTFVADDATGTAGWTSYEHDYRYAEPSNCLQVLHAQVSGIELVDWESEGGYVLTSLEDTSIDMLYLKSITTTTLFPPWFTKVLILTLAIELVYSLTQSSTGTEKLVNELEQIVKPKAMALDNRQGYKEEYNNDWVNAGR